MAAMSIKVSVVVAVYNPGRHIEGLITSLDEQSLSPGDFEVIFVDDGSTDGTRERLEKIAQTRPQFSVRSIPNSGWPGRPRNIGTDLATGDYVFFADNDDAFFPEALERMHTMAIENSSDIVYGKVIRAGRNTPFWSLAKRNIPVADPLRDGIVHSRTVHKLYRRAFLVQNGIRFPEGPVRLEDHNFMAQALPVARVVSVLADYPCYRWNHHSDGSNTSMRPFAYADYWGYFAEALGIFQRLAGPGEMTDAALLAGVDRMFFTARASLYLPLDDETRRGVFDPLHQLVARELPERLDAKVPVLKRARLAALRADDRGRFDRLQELRASLAFAVQLDGASWRDGKLHISVTSSLTTRRPDPAVDDTFAARSAQAGEAVEAASLFDLERSGDDLLLPLPSADGIPAGQRVLLPADHGALEVTVRHRTTRVEWPVHGRQQAHAVQTGTGVGLRVTCEAVLDPARNFFGEPLEDGIWDVLCRVQFLGESEVHRVPLPLASALPSGPVETPGRDVLAFRTMPGKLALRLPSTWREPAQGPRPGVGGARWVGDQLRITLKLPEGTDARWLRVRKRIDGATREAAIENATAAVSLAGTEAGDILDFYVHAGTAGSSESEHRLASAGVEVRQRAPYRIYTTDHGSFSVKHEHPGTTPIARVRGLGRRMITLLRNDRVPR